jgi:hypothetical protein
MRKRRDLLAEALALSPEERRALAHELLASVDDDIDAVEAWIDVAENPFDDGQRRQVGAGSCSCAKVFSPESRMLLASARHHRSRFSSR